MACNKFPDCSCKRTTDPVQLKQLTDMLTCNIDFIKRLGNYDPKLVAKSLDDIVCIMKSMQDMTNNALYVNTLQSNQIKELTKHIEILEVSQ